jgi:hypothetical protein
MRNWFWQQVFDYQTLIAGVLALTGAGWTVSAIRRQIQQTYYLEDERRAREETAARTVMPLALSSLTHYAGECIYMLDDFVTHGKNVPEEHEAPPLPVDAIGPLQVTSRHADESIITKIAALLGRLQVQHGRLKDLIDRSRGGKMHQHEGVTALVDAADVYARASELFDYARSTDETRRRAPKKNLISALHICAGIYDDDHPAIAYINELEDEPGELH